MKIGILELRDNEFIKDLVSRLEGFPVEFISWSSQKIPVKCEYKVIVDRLSHLNEYKREILKALSLNGTYVINSPFSVSLTNKIIDANICNMLGIPFPKTYILPLLDSEEEDEILKEPDFKEIIKDVELPCIIKPFDGFAWDNVYVINTMSELRNLYNALKSNYTLLIQEKIEWTEYYRVFCIGKECLVAGYEPKPRAMGRLTENAENSDIARKITQWSLKLNSAIGLDINSVEWAVDNEGNAFVIDAFNETPDIIRSQMPDSYYNWLVEKFAELVIKKFHSSEKNKHFFQILTKITNIK
ncbi:MAG: hypothetical protein DRP18_03510 [Candidatus Aenigmatarchaeota archaeon]|nr:MAG: hypothetical protein DRP18_03510 [Candidatus Aenigmarchaeota archaeon]RLJ06783.1 MAG: hypothetical protein DRP16_04650 [Candidatus Aenigmarchaeota archaeon]